MARIQRAQPDGDFSLVPCLICQQGSNCLQAYSLAMNSAKSMYDIVSGSPRKATRFANSKKAFVSRPEYNPLAPYVCIVGMPQGDFYISSAIHRPLTSP